jgi:glutathione S-transferase
MSITLYYAPTTCALVPYVNLTEAGAAFEVKRINMRKGDNKTPDYLAINPQHKVPALIVDGKILTENVAIQIWIARTYPNAHLLPADPWQELQAISFMSFCSSGIHPHLARFNGPKKYCDVPGIEEPMRRTAAEFIAENFRIAEGKLAGRDYFFDQFTAADTYFFWCFRRAIEFKLDLSSYPNCRAHFARMEARPSVAKLLAFESEVQASFAA